MSINLSGGNGSVAEHCLDGTDIGAIAQKVSGKRMTKGMRTDLFSNNTGSNCIFLYNTLNTTRSKAKFFIFFQFLILRNADKQRFVGIGTLVQISHKRCFGTIGEKYHTNLTALAANRKLSPLNVYVIPIQRTKLRHAKPSRKKCFQNCPVAQIGQSRSAW